MTILGPADFTRCNSGFYAHVSEINLDVRVHNQNGTTRIYLAPVDTRITLTAVALIPGPVEAMDSAAGAMALEMANSLLLEYHYGLA